jgi:hypothetical protein
VVSNDRFKIDYAKSVLRRMYPADQLDALKTYSLQVFAEATDSITVRSVNSEGGGVSGEITFEKVLLGQAIEELIQELDPTYQPPPPRVVLPDFRFSTPV